MPFEAFAAEDAYLKVATGQALEALRQWQKRHPEYVITAWQASLSAKQADGEDGSDYCFYVITVEYTVLQEVT